MQRINPFTRTPGVAGAAFIDMHLITPIVHKLLAPSVKLFHCSEAASLD